MSLNEHQTIFNLTEERVLDGVVFATAEKNTLQTVVIFFMAI